MGQGAPAIFRTSLVKFLLRRFGMTNGTVAAFWQALAMFECDPAYEDCSGIYFHSKNGVLSLTCSSVVSYGRNAAAKLWTDLERLVQLTSDERPVVLGARDLMGSSALSGCPSHEIEPSFVVS